MQIEYVEKPQRLKQRTLSITKEKLDVTGPVLDLDALNYCDCAKPAVEKLCSKGNNSGKYFYSCAQRSYNRETKTYEGGCNFFRWKTPAGFEQEKLPDPAYMKVYQVESLIYQAERELVPWVGRFEKLLRDMHREARLQVTSAYTQTQMFCTLIGWIGDIQAKETRYLLRQCPRTVATLESPRQNRLFLVEIVSPTSRGWVYTSWATHIVWGFEDDFETKMEFYIIPRKILLALVCEKLAGRKRKSEEIAYRDDALHGSTSDAAYYEYDTEAIWSNLEDWDRTEEAVPVIVTETVDETMVGKVICDQSLKRLYLVLKKEDLLVPGYYELKE